MYISMSGIGQMWVILCARARSHASEMVVHGSERAILRTLRSSPIIRCVREMTACFVFMLVLLSMPFHGHHNGLQMPSALGYRLSGIERLPVPLCGLAAPAC